MKKSVQLAHFLKDKWKICCESHNPKQKQKSISIKWENSDFFQCVDLFSACNSK